MFNLRLGCEILDQQGFPRKELVLSGGLTKTPELAQVLADVFGAPVSLLASAEEGTAWGAALLAKYRHLCCEGGTETWSEFLQGCRTEQPVRMQPDEAASQQYSHALDRYRRLMNVHSQLDKVCGV